MSEVSLLMKNLLGFHISNRLITISLSLSITLLFYVLSLGSFLKPVVWTLIDRVSYYEPFEGYIINKFVDNLVISLGVALWLSLALQCKRAIRFAVILSYLLLTTAAAVIGQQSLEIMAISSVPLVISLIVLNRVTTRKF